ncbi:MAG: DNA-binding protein [Prevotella sp.]|nr:DNA-binding protein [Prevotella sp.]
MSNIEATKGEIVMYQPDETIRLEVRVEEETVWLNRQQIADLFSRDIKTVSKHINNALKEELKEEPVGAKFATTAADGKNYQVEYFNLEMNNHDRFLIIDDMVYVFGASLKNAGKKLFAYIRMQETPTAQLLSNIR